MWNQNWQEKISESPDAWPQLSACLEPRFESAQVTWENKVCFFVCIVKYNLQAQSNQLVCRLCLCQMHTFALHRMVELLYHLCHTYKASAEAVVCFSNILWCIAISLNWTIHDMYFHSKKLEILISNLSLAHLWSFFDRLNSITPESHLFPCIQSFTKVLYHKRFEFMRYVRSKTQHQERTSESCDERSSKLEILRRADTGRPR